MLDLAETLTANKPDKCWGFYNRQCEGFESADSQSRPSHGDAAVALVNSQTMRPAMYQARCGPHSIIHCVWQARPAAESAIRRASATAVLLCFIFSTTHIFEPSILATTRYGVIAFVSGSSFTLRGTITPTGELDVPCSRTRHSATSPSDEKCDVTAFQKSRGCLPPSGPITVTDIL